MNEKFLLVPIVLPAAAALLIALLNLRSRMRRCILTEAAILLNSAAAALLVYHTLSPELGGLGALTLFRLSGEVSFELRLDGLGIIFLSLIAVLWPLTALYAFEYMEHEGHENRFFSWLTLNYGVVAGIALSANLLTLYFFYEVMTLTTLPLVMHAMDGRARYAGRKYLIYSVGGASCVFIALAFTIVHGFGGFAMGGILGGHFPKPTNMLCAAWFLGFIGFGVKAALFPLHSWLPSASVAPTPVSSLLHAAAVVKAGIFAIIRLTWYVFGTGLLSGTWAHAAAVAMACITVIYGSSAALMTQHLKIRFAYSTISQLSYILIGVLLMTPAGLAAGLTHMVGHALMKINLFFCTGAVMCRTHREYLFDMRGIGLGMKKTFIAMTVSGMALAGLPPLAGFIGKWQLGSACAAAGPAGSAGLTALGVSMVLTVMYIISMLNTAYMPGKNFDFAAANRGVSDPGPMMLAPIALLASASVLYGLFAETFLDFFARVAAGAI